MIKLVGAGKILSVVIPPAKVGKLKDLAKTGKISDIDFPDGGGELELPTIGGSTCVYSCEVGGVTRYVGITDDVLRRGKEHYKNKGGLYT